ERVSLPATAHFQVWGDTKVARRSDVPERSAEVAVPDWTPPNLKKDFRKAEIQGWSFKRTKNGGQARAPDGVNKVTFHVPMKQNARAEVLRKMRKYGYDP